MRAAIGNSGTVRAARRSDVEGAGTVELDGRERAMPMDPVTAPGAAEEVRNT